MDRIKPFCFLQGILDFDIVDKYISSRIMQYHGNQRNIVSRRKWWSVVSDIAKRRRARIEEKPLDLVIKKLIQYCKVKK